MPNHKPVIFLAFANDREDNARYLRNLTKELHEIEEALTPLRDSYEVIHYQGITLKILFDKFQEYGNRIVIFQWMRLTEAEYSDLISDSKTFIKICLFIRIYTQNCFQKNWNSSDYRVSSVLYFPFTFTPSE